MLGINNELTYTHTRTDSKRKTSKRMNFPKVFIQPTFRSVFQGKLEQFFGPSRKVIVINNHRLHKRDKRSLDYTIADLVWNMLLSLLAVLLLLLLFLLHTAIKPGWLRIFILTHAQQKFFSIQADSFALRKKRLTSGKVRESIFWRNDIPWSVRLFSPFDECLGVTQKYLLRNIVAKKFLSSHRMKRREKKERKIGKWEGTKKEYLHLLERCNRR